MSFFAIHIRSLFHLACPVPGFKGWSCGWMYHCLSLRKEPQLIWSWHWAAKTWDKRGPRLTDADVSTDIWNSLGASFQQASGWDTPKLTKCCLWIDKQGICHLRPSVSYSRIYILHTRSPLCCCTVLTYWVAKPWGIKQKNTRKLLSAGNTQICVIVGVFIMQLISANWYAMARFWSQWAWE